jgi:acyl carrier protein
MNETTHAGKSFAQAGELIRAWLQENNPAVGEIRFDAQLTAEGILDSFQFVNFLLYIEYVRGAEIDRSMVDPKSFATINAILANFFGGPAA